jgi:hypothetical protein
VWFSRGKITINELRKQFEYEFMSRMFSLERNAETGEYRSPHTFQAWGAYKLCAILNGVLPKNYNIYGEDAK